MSEPAITLGIGAERGVSAAELETLVQDTLTRHGLSRRAIACLASSERKRDEPAVLALAATLGVPTRFFDNATLNAEAARLPNPSETVQAAVGVPGVAEAAALAAAGAGGTLLVPKTRSAHATCAVAASGPGA